MNSETGRKVIVGYSIIYYLAAIIGLIIINTLPISDLINLGFFPISIYYAVLPWQCYSGPGMLEIYLIVTLASALVFSIFALFLSSKRKNEVKTNSFYDKINPAVLTFSATLGLTLIALQLGLDEQLQLGLNTVLILVLTIVLPIILQKVRRFDILFRIFTIVLAGVGIACVRSYILYATNETAPACNALHTSLKNTRF
ncbi:MAG: hypothetical protein Q4F60_00420 [Candidatus Saccharibacteria bacterium]|nr:hypothetical protein [Candidatus Saccharibacteria bacterium]